MDAVKARILEYVYIIDSSLDSELESEIAFLDFVVSDVMDRALLYMNRQQLVDQYEDDVATYNADSGIWINYPYPIPPQLERTLASVVVQSKQTLTGKTAGEKDVQSLSDNGQSITYRESMVSFLASSSDSEIFSGATKLMDKFRLATVIENN